MKLINADALREQIDDYKYFHSSFQKMTVAEFLTIVHDLIDNAPIVFSCNACKNMGNERECVDCHDYSNYVHYEERPTGEWIEHKRYYDSHSHRMMFSCECSACHMYEDFPQDDETGNVLTSHYCEYCGSNMWKETDNETN